MNEYTKQANDFLSNHGIKFTAKATNSGKCPMFCDNGCIHGEEYNVTFSRNAKRFSVKFWNSYNDYKKGISPTAYDVIACLTKYEPGSYEEFCGEYGYDTDSRKAQKIYIAVCKEWEKIKNFFTGEEIDEMCEIN